MSSDIKAPYCCCSILLYVIFDAIISKNFTLECTIDFSNATSISYISRSYSNAHFLSVKSPSENKPTRESV